MSEPLIDRLEVFASFHTSRVRYRDVEPFSDYDDLMSMVEEVKVLKDRVEKARTELEGSWIALPFSFRESMKKVLGGSST